MNTYNVKSGDSISIIARDVLRNITRWPEIAQLNKLSSPYLIFPGQTLILPDYASTTVDEQWTYQGESFVPLDKKTGAPATDKPTNGFPWLGFLIVVGLAGTAIVLVRKRRKKTVNK